MNQRERLLMALDHKEPDKVPLDLGAARACKITKAFYIRLLDYLGLPELKENVRVSNFMTQAVCVDDIVLEKLGCDIAEPEIEWVSDAGNLQTEIWEDDKFHYVKVDYGTTYRMPKDQMLYYDPYAFPLGEDEEDDENYVFPNPLKLAQSTANQMNEYKKAGYGTVFSRTYGEGFLTHGYDLYGMENWMCVLAGEPERAHSIMERFLEKKLIFWDNVLTTLGDSVDVVCLSDDFGAQNTLLVSKDMLLELVFPYLKKEIEFMKSKTNAKIFLHCCGACYEVIPEIIDAGVDILNPVQFTAKGMELEKLKREFGKDLTFWGGGIDTQHTLGKGTKQEIKDMVKRNTEIMMKDGGFVFTPVHNVQANVPVENFITMWETYVEYGKYNK